MSTGASAALQPPLTVDGGHQMAPAIARERHRKTCVIEHLIGWLSTSLPLTGKMSNLHGDIRIDQMNFCAGAPRMLAVLQGKSCTMESPLLNFTYH